MTSGTIILLIFLAWAGVSVWWALREERQMRLDDAINITAVQQDGQWQIFIWDDRNAAAMESRILEQQEEMPDDLWLSNQNFARVMGKIHDSRKERT